FMVAVTIPTDKRPPDQSATPAPPTGREEPLPTASLTAPGGPAPLAHHTDAVPASALTPRPPAWSRGILCGRPWKYSTFQAYYPPGGVPCPARERRADAV